MTEHNKKEARPWHGTPKADPFMVSVSKNAMEKMGFSPSARLPAGIVKIIADGKGDVKGKEWAAISTKTGEFESGFAK